MMLDDYERLSKRFSGKDTLYCNTIMGGGGGGIEKNTNHKKKKNKKIILFVFINC